jgi:hypothetical protein
MAITPPKAPTAPKAPAAPKAPEKETVVEEVPVEEVEAEKKTRSDKIIDQESINFVRDNVKTMSYPEMADACGLTKSQINQILMKLRQGLRDKALSEDEKAYGYAKTEDGQDKMAKDGSHLYDWNDPKTDFAKKIEAYINDKLSRPAEVRRAGKGSTVQNLYDSTVDDLLSSI